MLVCTQLLEAEPRLETHPKKSFLGTILRKMQNSFLDETGNFNQSILNDRGEYNLRRSDFLKTKQLPNRRVGNMVFLARW